MEIERNTSSIYFPYVIIGNWGQELECDKEDLEQLKKEIEEVLDESED